MGPTFIILIALWLYPIINYVLIRNTLNNIKLQRQVALATVFCSIIIILCIIFKISTILPTLDWWLFTQIYFTISLVLWLGWYQKIRLLKWISGAGMLCIFGFGYLSATVGILGMGFIMTEYTPTFKKNISDKLVYAETRLGSAVSDYRGKKVEVYQQLAFPLLERQILQKNYYDWLFFAEEWKIQYNPAEQKIYLSAVRKQNDKIYSFADILQVKMR